VIVASLHAGMEYRPTHGSLQEKYGNTLRSLGANIIIGNHPHVPQGIKIQDGVTQLYSLGNASFGGNTGVDEAVHCMESFMAQFELTFEDGVYKGHRLTIWPIHISGASPENNYQPVLVSGGEAEAVMKRIQKDTRLTLSPYVESKGAVQPFVPWEK
jgi:poly-gamma-glutamate synthesis protein (capsule biosynthesis protein)